MNTTFYAEYHNYGKHVRIYSYNKAKRITIYLTLGPGANTSERVSDHILTDAQAENFTIEKVFLEKPKWIDYAYES